MTPTNDLASLTGATDHATMTADETYRDCSTPAASDANPSLTLTGEVVLRLPSVFIRTVRAPVESRIPNSLIDVVGYAQDWRTGLDGWTRPRGENQPSSDDAEATAPQPTPLIPEQGVTGAISASLWPSAWAYMEVNDVVS